MYFTNRQKVALCLAVYWVQRRKKRVRSKYVRDILLRRSILGEMTLVREMESDPEYHYKYFRMTKDSFDKILDYIRPRIYHHKTHVCPISLEERLALTLRYVTGGSSQISMAFNYRISPTAVSFIVREVLSAIWDSMVDDYLPPPTKESMAETAKYFSEMWNFPNCVGSVDGKHVHIKCPNKSGSDFFNYKGYFSIVLLAVADANYKFTVVDIGAKGSQSDSGIFSNSVFGSSLYKGELDLPPDHVLPNSSIKMPHVFLGDDAFPLLPNLLRPYPRKSTNVSRRIFNYRLSRARRVVENAFGIWAARFRIFHTTLNASLETADLILKATTVLHNFLMDENDLNGLTVDSSNAGLNFVPGSWRDIVRNDTGGTDLRRFGTNNRTILAGVVRDTYRTFFNSRLGSVSWQIEAINM